MIFWGYLWWDDVNHTWHQHIKSNYQTTTSISSPSTITKGKAKFKQQAIPMRKRSSERIKLKWFQKPIIGYGSNPYQPMYLTEEEEGILTQEGNGSQNSKKATKKSS